MPQKTTRRKRSTHVALDATPREQLAFVVALTLLALVLSSGLWLAILLGFSS